MARILVIDDDNEIRTSVRMALELAGHQVLEAADGGKGLKSYEQDPTGLILCDLLMPEKEGLETIQELRRRFPDVKIIAMSGGMSKTRGDFLPLAKRFGAAKILYKPFHMQDLLNAVSEMCPVNSP